MNRTLSLGIIGVGMGALIATNCCGQNLSERIDHVMQTRARAQSNNSTKAQLLGSLLYTDVTVQFSEQPSRDVFKYLQTVLGVSMIVRYNDDKSANGAGIDPATPITLDASNKPGLTVLEMVLDQCGGDSHDTQCTWQLRDGFIEVGPKERLNLAREIRYYPIKDLLFEAPNFDNAPSLDLNSALNQAQNSGGSGGGSGGGGGGRGGSSGGGGGGGGGGGSGGVFGDPKAEPERVSEAERAKQIIDLIVSIVESDAWEDNGGSAASIRYYQGVVIVRAPDYIHRQIGGYPFAARPAGAHASAAGATEGRYVMFTGGLSNVQLADVRVSNPTGGTAGSTGTGTGTTQANAAKPSDAKPASGTPATGGSSSGSKPAGSTSGSSSKP